MRFAFSIILVLLALFAKGQSRIIYPDVFSGYFYNMSLVNPSYIPEEGGIELNTLYKFRRGLLSDITTFAASAGKTWNKKNTTGHALRIIAINEREGPYISSPKAYLNYGIKLPLSIHTSVMTGINLGFSGINFTAPSGSGSTMLLDGALGLILRHKNIDFGVSALQAFNTEGAAINASIKLQRFYNFHFSGEKSISPSFDLRGNFLWRSLIGIPDQYNAGGSFIFKRYIEFGAIYKLYRGVSYLGSVTLNPEANPLLITFTYNSALLSTSPSWSDSFEIGLRYLMK